MRVLALNYEPDNVDVWSEIDEAVGNRHAHLSHT